MNEWCEHITWLDKFIGVKETGGGSFQVIRDYPPCPWCGAKIPEEEKKLGERLHEFDVEYLGEGKGYCMGIEEANAVAEEAKKWALEIVNDEFPDGYSFQFSQRWIEQYIEKINIIKDKLGEK